LCQNFRVERKSICDINIILKQNRNAVQRAARSLAARPADDIEIKDSGEVAAELELDRGAFMEGSTLDGVIILYLLIAAVMTLVIGFAALVLLQRSILRHMAATRGAPGSGAQLAERSRTSASASLALVAEDPAAAPSARDRTPLFRVALAHTVAGLAFAIVATFLLLILSGMELFPVRTAMVTWAQAWPTVLVLCLLVGPDRRLQILIVLGYVSMIAIICVLAQIRGADEIRLGSLTFPGFLNPVFYWAIESAPYVFLLLFLNRTVRAIGPLVLVFVFILLIGGHAATTALSNQPILETVVRVTTALGIGDYAFWLVISIGMLAAAWPAYRCVAVLRDRYAAKRSSEFLMTVSTIWLLSSLILASSLTREQGAIGAVAAFLPILTWRAVLAVGLRRAVNEARARPPCRLLLLRVYGFGRRSRRLLDLLGSRWRLIGSIDLIAAPDLASRTVEPATFLEFVRGRLARLFIRTPEQLAERLATMDRAPDPDARFRINQLFCSNGIWREAVSRLMAETTLVVMDLRGFTLARQGCVYELQTLLDTVPIARLVFLFDRTSDCVALYKVLTDHWRQLDVTSPNLTTADTTIRFIDVTSSDIHAVRRLLAIAETAQDQ